MFIGAILVAYKFFGKTEPMMAVVENLRSFNRKERFHLVGQLIGNRDFRLDPIALQKVFSTLDLNLPLPMHYFSAMDYHLDWIYASLSLALDEPRGDGPKPRGEDNLCISATQEDVDFLIAFVDDSGCTHIIMIEAKGDAAFSNKQLESKARRLGAIFGEDGNKWGDCKKSGMSKVIPYFLVCSPKEIFALKTENLALFMLNKKTNRLSWFPLYMPADQRKATQCDEQGNTIQKGSHWKVDYIRELEPKRKK